MERARKANKPFFLWWNSTRMHIFTHLKKESEGKTGLGVYADGMVEHDGHVGQVLDKLRSSGLEENTIVMYSTDNGAETFTWPDGGTTMFRGEKNTQWEGGYRVPMLIRWPGVIKPGTVVNDVGAHEDMLTTLLAAAGDTTVKDDLIKGRKVGGSDLQGPSRRLQSPARAQGRGGVAAQGVHLLDRRRKRRGAALQQLEDHLPAPECPRPARSGRSLSAAACSHDHQPAHGSVRARRRGERHGLSALVVGAHVPLAPGAAPTSANGCRASASSRRARSPAASISTA